MMTSFSCCWKDVRLKHEKRPEKRQRTLVSVVVERMYDWSYSISLKIKQSWEVSVVVERMYDWSPESFKNAIVWLKFQLLLKGCTIEASIEAQSTNQKRSFQLLLKGCTIEAKAPTAQAPMNGSFSCCWKDVRLKLLVLRIIAWFFCFSCCWKDVRLKHILFLFLFLIVSVVVERMYDWS